MKIATLATRLKTLPMALRQAAFPPESRAYQAWRQRFLGRRLAIALNIAIPAYLTFIALRLFLGVLTPSTFDVGWLIMASSTVLGLFLNWLVLHGPVGRRHPEIVFLVCSWLITLVEQVWATLKGIAFPGVFTWTLVFLAQATLMPVRWPLHLVSQLGVMLYYVGVNAIAGLEQDTNQWDTTLWLYIFWFCIICDLSVYLYERLQRTEFEVRRDLEAEREKSERLLLNILPATVAQQLKQEHRTIAEHFSEVTVLFADIVGFTQLSTQIPPKEMVTLLNQIFSEFDLLAEQYGLEKIKTIGDSYMVVGGLPIERPDHLEAIADMALKMQQTIAQMSKTYQRPLTMRIGINTGPVVAGVIGVKRFIYDLWGDTVNTASRMESHGVPGAIQVTEAVYEKLGDRYQFEERGLISVKGKGSMRVYLLLGKCRSAAESAP